MLRDRPYRAVILAALAGLFLFAGSAGYRLGADLAHKNARIHGAAALR